ncbi:hypothetical protein MSAN_00276600 [Mycena sanguinolenta]|uniref:Uncharacterized protein n=1 Tax=Mycena sanguinolenta TaxID=230812 RepID=A0A8H7DM23_9AGAR|nr:hypothetical protein MSAN_00276600 [Mycena sanguinolenta]
MRAIRAAARQVIKRGRGCQCVLQMRLVEVRHSTFKFTSAPRRLYTYASPARPPSSIPTLRPSLHFTYPLSLGSASCPPAYCSVLSLAILLRRFLPFVLFPPRLRSPSAPLPSPPPPPRLRSSSLPSPSLYSPIFFSPCSPLAASPRRSPYALLSPH